MTETAALLAPPAGHYAVTVDGVGALLAGDQLVAFDGHPLRVTREVAPGYPRAADGARRLVNPNEDASGVEWWLYPDQVDRITVHRPKPAPVPAIDVVLAALARDVPRLACQRREVRPGYYPPVPVGLGFIGDDVAVGDVVLVPDIYWRAGVVIKVGPKRVQVRSTSAYALDHGHPGVVLCQEPYYPRHELICRAPARGWTQRAREIGATP